MTTDKKIQELETLSKILESEKNFDKTIEYFTKAATLVKELVTEVADRKGQVFEIIKNTDGFIERSLKLDNNSDDDE